MDKKIIVIAGTTATGKTETAISLAEQINAEIISADSMQVYKYMNIGTAKPSKEQLARVKHYMIDELYPDEEFSVAVFKGMASKYIDEISSRDKNIIVAGGTGFYINALINNNDFTETIHDNSYRNELYEFARTHGNQALHNLLIDIDYESYEKIHYNNVVRIVRALEYFKLTNQKISKHNELEKKKKPRYNTHFIILNRDREDIYERINQRVDVMIKQGLIEEVKDLLSKGYHKNLVSMQGLGYKEIVSFLEGECTKSEAIEKLKTSTRHFAKRQITWFKHQCEGTWLDADKIKIGEIVDIIHTNKKAREVGKWIQ